MEVLESKSSSLLLLVSSSFEMRLVSNNQVCWILISLARIDRQRVEWNLRKDLSCTRVVVVVVVRLRCGIRRVVRCHDFQLSTRKTTSLDLRASSSSSSGRCRSSKLCSTHHVILMSFQFDDY